MATILVVDDRPATRPLLVSLLRCKGHRMLEAEDGGEALALVRSARPDLVICDIVMPTMDGYQFVRELRGELRIAATNVILRADRGDQGRSAVEPHSVRLPHVDLHQRERPQEGARHGSREIPVSSHRPSGPVEGNRLLFSEGRGSLT